MKKIEEEKKKRLQHSAGWRIDHNTTIRIISKPPLLPFLINTNNSRSVFMLLYYTNTK